MCGIFFSLRSTNFVDGTICDGQLKNLQRRGPDVNCKKVVSLGDQLTLEFQSWVLHMRGSQVVHQPIASGSNILIWNGEIFGFPAVGLDESDTTTLSKCLNECKSEHQLIETISRIQGPYTIIYYSSELNKLYFCRDYFGRRSLLINVSDQSISLASVGYRTTQNSTKSVWNELPCLGIFYLDMNMSIFNKSMNYFPWECLTHHGIEKALDFDDTLPFAMNSNSQMISPFGKIQCLEGQNESPNELPSHILKSMLSMSNLAYSTPHSELLKLLVSYCDSVDLWPHCTKLLEKLELAVSERVVSADNYCNTKGQATIGVLFSGGIDCTVIALLAHRFTSIHQPIDLINVAFEQQKQGTANKTFDVPDRITGVNSLLELKKLCPDRQWNFVKVDTNIVDLQCKRTTHITNLTYPKTTVLDDSIACALWFASKGEGTIDDGKLYKSSAKVLLCGMGADEQLGGYSRHRGVFEKMDNSWEHLTNELNVDIERIGSRNLGRDDRIISDHGKEGRFPYLDNNVVEYLQSLPTFYKSDLRLPRGVGEKIILRGAAYLLGLRDVAVYPKRAIQFGSRIAKAEGKKEKGGDICKRLTNVSLMK